MSKQNVEAAERLIAALNERDIAGYLVLCTDDVQLRTPWAPVEGTYHGREAILRFFADLDDALPDFRLNIERAEAVGADRVLVLLQASVSGRASGISVAAARGGVPDASGPGHLRTATILDFTDGKVARIRVFLDREEAREAAASED